jgi:hypothetical protein
MNTTDQIGTDDGTQYKSAIIRAVSKCESDIVRADDERRRVVKAPEGIDVESKWVKFIGWAKHLQDKDKALFSTAGHMLVTITIEIRIRYANVIKENRRLRLLVENFKQEIYKSIYRLNAVPVDTLKWLASVDPTKPEGELFSVKQEIETTNRYISYWQYYICYYTCMQLLNRMAAKQ